MITRESTKKQVRVWLNSYKDGIFQGIREVFTGLAGAEMYAFTEAQLKVIAETEHVSTVTLLALYNTLHPGRRNRGTNNKDNSQNISNGNNINGSRSTNQPGSRDSDKGPKEDAFSEHLRMHMEHTFTCTDNANTWIDRFCAYFGSQIFLPYKQQQYKKLKDE